MLTDAAEYVYVDTAVGGVDRRNHVKRIDEVRVNGQADAYAMWQRATVDLLTHLRTHRNAGGNPTVKGFEGPTWAPRLVLDFDWEPDPAVALEWLRRVVRKLESWDVPLAAIRLFYSGGKGFHAEVPAALFGGFEPSVELARRLKRAAELILEDIPFDHSVYDRTRLWRLPGSRHGKTGRYKTPLTAAAGA